MGKYRVMEDNGFFPDWFIKGCIITVAVCGIMCAVYQIYNAKISQPITVITIAPEPATRQLAEVPKLPITKK